MKRISSTLFNTSDRLDGPDGIDISHVSEMPDRPRRRFVQGLGSAAILAGLPFAPFAARAAETAGAVGAASERGRFPDNHASPHTLMPFLSGTEFDLTIGKQAVNLTGRPAHAVTVNGLLPGPILRWKQGETVTIRVTNTLSEPTSIHWHGIVLPYQMDGVPGISFPGIAPGETFVYRFPVLQAGTYWYHSHSGFQEQVGLYGALVIEPQEPPPAKSADHDYVVLLSDWTDENPKTIFNNLKASADYYNYQMPAAGLLAHDIQKNGLKSTLAERAMWNKMRMNPTDLLDVSGATFTYLTNGLPPAANWTALAQPGEKVRLRFINGSTSTFFDVRIPGITLEVVSADGQEVAPVTVDEFRMGPAETYDVMVVMPDDRAYTLFCESMDRSGYARGTLAPRVGMQAAIPPLGPKTWLSMADMGMDHMDMQHMDMKHMGMDHMDMKHGRADIQTMPATAESMPLKTGPQVDMRVMHPSARLDDPGPGLRNNGRRTLTYADLRTIGGPLDPRLPSRDLVIHLTGNMNRFIWGFDGLKHGEAPPYRFHSGERLRIVLINDTMMNHPIHLHGMFSEVEAEDGTFQVRKHTVNVQPAKRIAFRVSANAPGQWAFHCHLLYHMEAGMFRMVVVA